MKSKLRDVDLETLRPELKIKDPLRLHFLHTNYVVLTRSTVERQ